jgi:hypothetical protein
MKETSIFREGKRTQRSLRAPISSARQPTATPSIPQTLTPGGTLERYVQHLADQDQFSGTLLVARGAQPILLQAYGQANKAQHLPNRLIISVRRQTLMIASLMR